jgi:signal transduction histidine kinase
MASHDAGRRPVRDDGAGDGAADEAGRGRLRTVRVRLMLLVLLPMVGLVALAAGQVGTAMAVLSDAARGVRVADAAAASAGLIHELERELAETVALRDRGGSSGKALVQAQRSRTDAALRRYQHARDAALGVAGALAGVYAAADAQLEHLSAARAGTADQTYRDITAAVVEVGQALPSQLRDPRLAGQARAIAELAAASHALAEQRDLVRAALTRGSYTATDQAGLAALAAVERERRAAFLRVADPSARVAFEQLWQGPDVQNTTRIRDAALAGSVLGTDADFWYVAATHGIRLLHEVQLTVADQLHRTATAQQSAARRATVLTVGGSGVVGFATVAIAVALATRISRRLRRLRDASLDIAGRELPAAIEELAAAADPMAVHDAQVAAADTVLTAGPSDEIGQVGQTVAAVHRQALRLATAQAIQRLDTASVLAALARRNQTLVQRQLQAIDDLERDETDPDLLAAFYTVDHLAARMRRNSENLLVLAGSEPGRRFTAAQPLMDVIRAAGSEILEYTRVEPEELVEVEVVGHAVGDLVHLLAELLENATTYSAPETRVRVTARHQGGGVLLAIYDDGIGMAAEDLAEANHRLAARVDLTASLAGTMGLLVVARLAARHGIEVRLRSHPGTGTAALIHLPGALLTVPEQLPGTDPLRRLRNVPQPRVVATATVAVPAAPLVTAVIYEELSSAWFRPSTPVGNAAPLVWGSPGDREHAQVVRVLTSHPESDRTAGGLPVRRPGARLVPGSVPVPGSAAASASGVSGPFTAQNQPVRADPDRIRTRLTGFASAVRAVERDASSSRETTPASDPGLHP